MMIALPRWLPPSTSTPSAVVLVNSSMFARVPGPAEAEATVATISPYATGADAGDGMDDGNGRLAPARDEVDVLLGEVFVKVDGRDDVGSDGRRRQVHRQDAGLAVARRVRPMDLRRGRFEDEVGQLPLAQKPVDAVSRGLEP